MKYEPNSTESRRAATHAIYLTLHRARGFYHPKTLRTVMCEMMYAEPQAWRAVGITRAALAAYADAGHRPIKGLERAHLTDRSKMVSHVFDREEPLSCDELFSYWIETDQVVIAMRAENRAAQLGGWISFENPDASLFTRAGIGFVYRGAIEGALTRRLAVQIEAAEL